MKNIFFITIATWLTACNVSTSNTSDKEAEYENIKIEERDTSINASNAYNNFFFDTAALSSYLTSNEVSDNEAAAIRNFYNKRNFGFAWFNPYGVTEELRNFWNAYTYTDTSKEKSKADKKLFGMMDTLLPSTDSTDITKTDTVYTNAEIAITRKFLSFMRANHKNDDNRIARLLPVKKYTVKEYADMVLKEERDTSGMTKIERQYDALREQLKSVMASPQAGTNDTIAYVGKIKKGGSSPSVAAVKRKLAANGYLASADTSSVYNDTLATALKQYQASSGLKDDGVLNDEVIKSMNKGPQQLAAQLLVNMNRLLWLPPHLPDHYIQVNIPEFMLHAYEGDKQVFDMAVVVGREGTSTMMFSGDMNNIVFSPYWNVPESIVKKEILPGMDRNPDYLANHHMEITGKRNDLPVVRQLPGEDNSLGKVKFLFPNSYDIYLHDTNAKYLFNRDKRAFSHGCIRLQNAERMANYILRNDASWDSVKIHDAMNSTEEKWVKLKEQEPVLITYLTTWVDETGKLNIREDIYGHDEAAVARLFHS